MGDAFIKKVRRTALAATVYNIWRRRNLKIFQNKQMLPDKVISKTIRDIRGLVTSWKDIAKTIENSSLCIKLNVPL